MILSIENIEKNIIIQKLKINGLIDRFWRNLHKKIEGEVLMVVLGIDE